MTQPPLHLDLDQRATFDALVLILNRLTPSSYVTITGNHLKPVIYSSAECREEGTQAHIFYAMHLKRDVCIMDPEFNDIRRIGADK